MLICIPGVVHGTFLSRCVAVSPGRVNGHRDSRGSVRARLCFLSALQLRSLNRSVVSTHPAHEAAQFVVFSKHLSRRRFSGGECTRQHGPSSAEFQVLQPLHASGVRRTCGDQQT
jgi:hypothetical protein